MATDELKTCTACNVAKPKSDYYVIRSRNNALFARCKPCMNAESCKRQRDRNGHAAAREARLQLEADTGLRMCVICEKELPLDGFYPKMRRCEQCNNSLQLDNQRKRRGLSPTALRLLAESETGMRTCTRCERTLPLEEYTFKHGNRLRQCAGCVNTDMREYLRQLKRTNPDEVRRQSRASRLKSRYGLTEEGYDELLVAQGNRCAMCLRKKILVVDHCHQSGRVRGLLCDKCNTALGLLGDNLEGAYRAVRYLEISPAHNSIP